MEPWLIAVIVISVLAGVTLLALSIWWCVWVTRRNNRRQAEMVAQNQQAEMAFNNNAYDPRTQPQWGGGGYNPHPYPYPASHVPPSEYGAPPPAAGYGPQWSGVPHPGYVQVQESKY